MSEQKLSPEQVKELTRARIEKNEEAESKFLDKAILTVETIKRMWAQAQASAVARIQAGEDPATAIFEETQMIQAHHINAIYNAAQFVDMYQYHVTGEGEFDVGVRYIIDDHIQGFRNSAPCLPRSLLNIDGGELTADLSTDPIPVTLLEENPTEAKVPVLVETFDAVFYGYLENFRFVNVVDGTPIQIVTTAPAIRVNQHWVTLNSVYRWKQISEEELQKAWAENRWMISKVKPAQNEPNQTQA